MLGIVGRAGLTSACDTTRLHSGGREAESVAFRLAARLRRRSDSEAHSSRISVHDPEDVSAADSSRGDYEGSRRGRVARHLPMALVDLQWDVPPVAVFKASTRVVVLLSFAVRLATTLLFDPYVGL